MSKVKTNTKKRTKSKIYHLMSPDGVGIENLYTGESWADVKSAVENFTTDLIANVTKEFFANPENEGKKPDTTVIRESVLDIKKKLSGSAEYNPVFIILL